MYGPNKPHLRKDFWLEIQHLFGLTYPKWCVGGDFNVIRRSSEKLGGTRLTPTMRLFDELIRDLELIDPPPRNVTFTWPNLQQVPTCKRLDRFLFTVEWDSFFCNASKWLCQDGHLITIQFVWLLIISSGVQHLLDLRICG